jgi:LPXTG-motif cell wall-anchored protein
MSNLSSTAYAESGGITDYKYDSDTQTIGFTEEVYFIYQIVADDDSTSEWISKTSTESGDDLAPSDKDSWFRGTSIAVSDKCNVQYALASSPDKIITLSYSDYGWADSTKSPATVDSIPKLSVKEGSKKGTITVSATVSKDGVFISKLSIVDSESNLLFNKFYDSEAITEEVALNRNDTFMCTVYTNDGAYAYQDIEISDYPTISGSNDETKTDTEAPTIAYSGIPDSAEKDTAITISIKTNEICTIVADGEFFKDVNKAELTIYDNGVYRVTATDAAGNTSTKEIEVTSYSANSNLYDPDNRDTFWGDAITGNLPKTGDTAWFVIVGVSGAVMLIGLILVFYRKRGISNNKISKEDVDDVEK